MKSPFWNRLKASAAFTLIELLTVIAIIAILMGLLFPAIGAVRESARKASARNDETQIVTAVKAYYTEYGKYPINSGTAGTPAKTTTYTGVPNQSGSFSYADYDDGASGNNSNDTLIDVLRNNTVNTANLAIVASLNPRQIVFYDAPSVKSTANPASGVIPNGATSMPANGKVGMYYDAWGTPYRIRIDASYSNFLPNPYTDSAPPGGAYLTTGVISWAYGKNGALGGGSVPAGLGGRGFTSESGTLGSYYSTPGNNTTPTSGDVISWQ